MNAIPTSIPRVGLIGVSGYAGIHLRLLREAQDAGRVVFASAVVINPEEEPVIVRDLRARRVHLYSTFDDFIAAEQDRLDLCFVPTGIRWHAPMTVAALRAGMNVLVEKPLAGCLKDADAIIRAERETGRFVAVGFQDMYVEETRWLKRRLLEGVIGKLKSIRFVGLWPRPCAYYTRNGWAGRLVYDGVAVNDSPFNNAFAHFVHLSLFLAGADLESNATARLIDAELFRAHAIESFDTGVIRARAASGVDLWFGASHACDLQREPEIHLEGSSGRAVWFYDDRCTITPYEGTMEERRVPTAEQARDVMAGAVLKRLRDASVFISTAEAGRSLTALIEEMHATTEIRTLDPGRVDLVAAEGSGPDEVIPAIRGLPEALDRAFSRGSTLGQEDLRMDKIALR